MKVSIITAVLNGGKTIEDCLKSVGTQTYHDIEHIVIDGGSTDDTKNIIQSCRDKIAIFVSEPDKGVYDAMNKGLKRATGDIVAILNCDDMYSNNESVADMVHFIDTNNLDSAYADIVYIDRTRLDKITRFWKSGDYEKGAFHRGWVPPHPTFFCRRHIFEKYGYFNGNFQIAADFELMLRFIETHQITVGYLPKVIVKMRKGGKANVLRGVIRGNLEILKSFRLNGLRLSPWFFVNKPIAKISQLFIRPV